MNTHETQLMSINQKRICNVENYLAHFREDQEFRLTFSIANPAVLGRLGFSDNPQEGDAILPPIVGPVSRYNAEGRWLVHRDHPKKSRYIRTIWWTRFEWHGPDREEVEESVDIYRECYQRDLSPPPAVSVTYVIRGSVGTIVSPVLRKRTEEYNRIRHVVNLFLELFGHCVLLPEGSDGVVSDLPVRYVNWKFLPPGKYPWDRVEGHLQTVLKGRSEGIARVIMERQAVLHSHGPDEVHIGTGGFRDYIAYIFAKRGVVVLESIMKDNAMYIFDRAWQRFSQLTKAEVISNNHHKARIIHTKDWKAKLGNILDQET